jgi:hypothetical protein
MQKRKQGTGKKQKIELVVSYNKVFICCQYGCDTLQIVDIGTPMKG